MKHIYLLLVVFVLALNACSKAEKKVERNIVEHQEAPYTRQDFVGGKDEKGKECMQNGTGNEGKKADLNLEEDTYTHTNLKEGEITTDKFYFTNTGNDTLVIYHVGAECECISGNYPSSPIAPGVRDSIEVTFNSKDCTGEFERSVYVISNAKHKLYFLTINGTVK